MHGGSCPHVRRSVRVVVALSIASSVVAACGGAPSRMSASEFIQELQGSAHVNYVHSSSLEEAGSAADVVVLGRLIKVATGPTLGPEGRGGIPTAAITAQLDRRVKGDPRGATVEFIVARGADFDESELNRRRPDERVMLLLHRRADGVFELPGAQGLLTETDEGVRPSSDEVDEYTRDVGRYRTLDQASAAVAPG